jgi:hypothetical protein
MSVRTALLVTILLIASPVLAQTPPAPPGRVGPAASKALVPVIWLEAVPGSGKTAGPPLLRELDPHDPRLKDCERWLDNEPARFTRELIAWAWKSFGTPASWPQGRLAILLRPGGNQAEFGFRLQRAGAIEDHADVPYIILEADPKVLSDTVLHEGGHLLHMIAVGGRHPSAGWTSVMHSTFAVTDPLTALAEGYAIHFETLLGHYGRDAEKRAYYHRLAPAFDLKNSRRAEFYAPIADLMTFSQSWARYQAVRDTWPAFEGHVYPGDYLRSQYDPARDRARLKSAGAMVASEGVAASALFWISATLADRAGATPGQGLDQPALVAAEQRLLNAISALPAKNGFRPDIVDLVSAIGAPGSPERAVAVSRFVNVTRAVTAKPEARAKWTALYHDAVGLDIDGAKPLFADLDVLRDGVIDAATRDPAALRSGLGPVLPVRTPKVLLELKALGEKFPLEFDLNAAGDAEWLAAGADRVTAEAIGRERDGAPFSSAADFERRIRMRLATLGLEEIKEP